MKSLWMDESGAVVSAELIIILTILVCGTVVGFTTLRDALVTELGDVANAIGSLNQTYSYGGVVGHHAACTGSVWTDLPDDCDEVCGQSGTVPACIQLCGNVVHEGDAGAAFSGSPAGSQ
jgi:hypothetical protein